MRPIQITVKYKPKHGPTTWAGLVLLGAALEAIALRNQKHEATLSHATREFFDTDTPVGRAAFVAAWVGLSAWFVPHILNGVSNSTNLEVCK